MSIARVDDADQRLIDAIEGISTGRLRHISHGSYVQRISSIAGDAIKQNGSCLLILIESIKNCPGACYKRDLLFDVLRVVVTSGNTLSSYLIYNPFENYCDSVPWKELANAIVSIPDLVANCQAQSKVPELCKETFYIHLLDQIYSTLGELSSKPKVADVHVMYLVQILGRVALSDSGSTVWSHFTSRALIEPDAKAKSFAARVLQLPSEQDARYESLEIFLERLYLPVFFNLKPTKSSRDQIHSLLGTGILVSELFEYLICNKCMFKINYTLDRQRQAVILFNISAYLSSLVSLEKTIGIGTVISPTDVNAGRQSLLIRTLMRVVRDWASNTKVLLRTYEHTRYITTALLILFRYAHEHDSESLSEHASEIQSTIASVVPTYLNRASQVHRDLAICLGKLLFPRLRELMNNRRGANSSAALEEFDLDWSVDPTADIVYLRHLFEADIQEIFRDFSCDLVGKRQSDVATATATDATTTATLTISAGTDCERRGATSGVDDSPGRRGKAKGRGRIGVQLPPSALSGAAASEPKLIVELDDDSYDSTTAKQIICPTSSRDDDADEEDDGDSDDDLKPYAIDENGASDEDDDFELSIDAAANVPIYLHDCIEGLLENNNRRYVRLCLMKAGELIDQVIKQDEKSRADKMSFVADQRYDSAERRTQVSTAATATAHALGVQVDGSIGDVGVELARALLFLDNQFNLEGFKDYRTNALVSLCCAAPQLVGKYLIEEFNGTNRGMQQQLDILHVLVASAERLSSNQMRPSQYETSAPSPSPSSLSSLSSPPSSSDGMKRGLEKKLAGKQINIFAQYASMYFYGVVYRLKADFMDNKSLIISQPASIVSAFRRLKCQPIECAEDDVQDILSALPTRGKETATTTTTTTTTATRIFYQQQNSTTTTTSRKDIDNNNAEDFANVDKFLERNSLSDDSHLLSKIFLATALVIQSARQQPVVCKLSGDLVEILAAYRCHPDPGVQDAMLFCLSTIRSCTPQVYYENFLERRMLQLFGPWLANGTSSRCLKG